MKRLLHITTMVLGTLALATACGSSTTTTKKDGAAGSGGGGSAGSTAGAGGGGSGGSAGSDAAAGRDGAADGGAPSAEFATLYNTILSVRCAPCHTTQAMKPPGNNPLDMSTAATAFTSLTTVSTLCGAPSDGGGAVLAERRRVVAANPDTSSLILKLLGTQPAGPNCGQRMPRTGMRTDPPSCVDSPDGGADGGSIDAGPVVLDGGGGDGAAVMPPPRACLGLADMTAVRTWIMNGAR
jgi:hypothetical protein